VGGGIDEEGRRGDRPDAGPRIPQHERRRQSPGQGRRDSGRQHQQGHARLRIEQRLQGSDLRTTAIIVGPVTGLVKTATGTETRRSAWTDTWIKQADGQWLCVASQSARLVK